MWTRMDFGRRRRAGVAFLVVGLLVAACSSGSSGSSTTTSTPAGVPDSITSIMQKPRYAGSTWSLMVTDVKSGESFYELNADQMSLTGSTRKLFSVGEALDQLGADHRQTTPVFRQGTVAGGVLQGNLILVADGDLEFGGRRIDADTVQYTNFDHNDANGLGSAVLTPQEPLYALNDLARQVKASGITSVSGDVVIDSRMFDSYRVPNGNLLITPMMVNENMVDLTVTPGAAAGQPATVAYRPQTAALAVDGAVQTVAAGAASDTGVKLSDDSRPPCIGTPGCTGTVSGELPLGYKAPLTGIDSFVGTFRIEDPDAFARTAFIEALARNGVTVTAPPVAANDAAKLSATVLPGNYPADTQVATYQSAPFAQTAQLVLKVSLNLGANLSLSLFGLTQGERTVQGALAAERKTLTQKYGVDGSQFNFPTNGSGTPDSQASPRALVQMLTAMNKTSVAGDYLAALPVLGENGSLATAGTSLPGKGHVFAKPGTTISPDANDELQLKAQNLAGYIKTKSGRTVAYALMVNDAGPVHDIETDVSGVFEDEAGISSIIYESL
jgi:PBP4 family serine-type D-alanyl-D-alanine carboxypeptidase